MAASQGIKILIVDDEETIRHLIHNILSDAGYEPISAENATQAYEAFDSQSPQLAVVDNFLPDYSGLELMQKIRKTNQAIPLVMMTGVYLPAIEKKAEEAGCTHFIRKDEFEVNSFLKVVADLLSKSQKSA